MPWQSRLYKKTCPARSRETDLLLHDAANGAPRCWPLLGPKWSLVVGAFPRCVTWSVADTALLMAYSSGAVQGAGSQRVARCWGCRSSQGVLSPGGLALAMTERMGIHHSFAYACNRWEEVQRPASCLTVGGAMSLSLTQPDPHVIGQKPETRLPSCSPICGRLLPRLLNAWNVRAGVDPPI